MKTIYKAGGITEAHIVAGMLEALGIQSYVGGHHLQGGVGEIATMDFARVQVDDEDYETALPLIAEYEQRALEINADNESDTAEVPTATMGIFTKPVLFWIALILLFVWFVFRM